MYSAKKLWWSVLLCISILGDGLFGNIFQELSDWDLFVVVYVCMLVIFTRHPNDDYDEMICVPIGQRVIEVDDLALWCNGNALHHSESPSLNAMMRSERNCLTQKGTQFMMVFDANYNLKGFWNDDHTRVAWIYAQTIASVLVMRSIDALHRWVTVSSALFFLLSFWLELEISPKLNIDF